MRLRLLLRGPSRLLSEIPEKVLESGHLVIGRSPEADWMIPDPDKVISKAHCRIDRTERGFMLTDTSTNGVRVNNMQVGRGLPSLLSDGDVLMLGDAVIGVEIRVATPMAAPVVAVPPSVATIVPLPVTPVTAPVAESRPFSMFRGGPFDLDADEIEPPVAAKAVVPLQEVPAGQPLLQDWWDPNAASGKHELPMSIDASSENPGAGPVSPVVEQTSLPSQNGDNQMFSWTAGGIDAKRVLQAVGVAAQVLSKDERENFERRLREILHQESEHSH